jgi:hypothetical protein
MTWSDGRNQIITMAVYCWNPVLRVDNVDGLLCIAFRPDQPADGGSDCSFATGMLFIRVHMAGC